MNRNTRLCIWDLGGQQSLHKLWEKYYNSSHGIIFVIDSTDMERIEQCTKILGI